MRGISAWYLAPLRSIVQPANLGIAILPSLHAWVPHKLAQTSLSDRNNATQFHPALPLFRNETRISHSLQNWMALVRK